MYRTRDDGATCLSSTRRAPLGLTARMIEPKVNSVSSRVTSADSRFRTSQSETASRPKGLCAVGACSGRYQEVPMAFSWRPRRAPTAVPPIRVPVFAVGADVYVACAGDRSARATLTDDAGKKDLASLGDGTQVPILGWRPGWSGPARYRVRATDSGLE